MKVRPAFVLRLFPLLLAAGWTEVFAQGRSPFTPPAAAAPAAAAAAPSGGLEYRGNLDLGDGLQFRLFDPARKNGIWVRLNQRNDEFDVTARRYDDEQKTLTVEHQGRSLTLSMRVAKVVSGGSPAQMVPPPPPPGAPGPAPAVNVAPAVTQSVVVNPTPADEQRRLEAVAAEVARRRALREQASQQVSQGVVPTPATPQAR
ncbi:MAG: hypothetical protein RLZZ188_1194 [Verrucomicrobiota bacterium]